MTIKASFQIFIAALSAFSIFSPLFSLANGGDQRIVEGKYMINLSRAPFTPRVGDKTQMLASFVNLKTNKLVSEDMIVKIRISKLGGGAGKREFIYEQNNIKVTGGVLDFSYIFNDTGLHEIFFDFAFASSPEIIYEAPDFLMDVQSSEVPQNLNRFIIGFMISAIAGVVFGFVFGLWLGQRRT